MGSRPEKQLLEKVDQQLMSYQTILGYHDLMIHEYGPNRIYAVIDIELDSTLSLDKAHEIVDRIERDFGKKNLILILLHTWILLIFAVEKRHTLCKLFEKLSIHMKLI